MVVVVFSDVEEAKGSDGVFFSNVEEEMNGGGGVFSNEGEEADGGGIIVIFSDSSGNVFSNFKRDSLKC